MSKQPPKTDYYTKPGAAALVERVVTYWHRRGYHGIVATRYQHPDFIGLWFIRSNIGPSGFPPRRVGIRVC